MGQPAPFIIGALPAPKTWQHPITGMQVSFAYSTLERWLYLACRRRTRRQPGRRQIATETLRRQQRLISACQEKGIAEDYRGGCFAVNYGENGDMFKPSEVEHAFTLLKRSVCAGCSHCGH
jgi:hypothetical protein